MVLRLTTLVLVASVAFALGHPTTNQLVSLKTSSNLRGTNSLGMFDGKPTTIEKHPYIVAIYVSALLTGEATIVSDTWVVLAADTVSYPVTPNDVTVIAASDDAETGKTFKANQIVIHPKYGNIDYDYDYACVQIKGKFKWSDKIKPAKLPSHEPKVGTNMVVAGWGDQTPPPPSEIGDEVPSNKKLQEGHMKWFDKKACAKIYAVIGQQITDRMACAYNKGKTTLCYGDWGDSFVSHGVFYGMFISGILDGFCTKNAKPILLSDISTEAAWIKNTTGAKFENKNLYA